MASVHVRTELDSEPENDEYSDGSDPGASAEEEGEPTSDAQTDEIDKRPDADSDKDDHSASEESESELSDTTKDESALSQDTKSGISDVMAKILGKAIPSNKNPVLARGQIDREIHRKRRQREKESGVIKKKSRKVNDESSTESESDDESRRKYRMRIEKKKEFEELGHVKPSVLDKDKERNLQKIATRGVVQLFNAVRQQQNILGERLSEAGSSQRRRDKALGSLNKKNFLDLLDSTKAAPASKAKEINQNGSQKDEPGTWSILRDDFMMGAKMKDWDKEDSD